MQLQRNVDLSSLNTLALSAVADYYVVVSTVDELINAVDIAREKKLTVRPLGDGSNVVLADQLDTLVIDVRLKGIDVVSENKDSVLVQVSAGENWHEFVLHCIQQGWYGLENLALIPGRVGACPIQNIGAYGVEVADCIESLEFLPLDGKKIKQASQPNSANSLQQLNHDKCEFAYRESIFMRELVDKTVITTVSFRLQKCFKAQLSYPALQSFIEKQLGYSLASEADRDSVILSASQVAAAVVDIRQQKLPDPKILPNVGSFFKNVEMVKREFERFIQSYPEAPYYVIAATDTSVESAKVKEQSYKIPSAWLIDQSGLKGYCFERSGLMMHTEQALVMVNPNRKATASDIIEFAQWVQATVHNAFAIHLEIEPRLFL